MFYPVFMISFVFLVVLKNKLKGVISFLVVVLENKLKTIFYDV